MTAKWIVALACGAALGLGACSGSNPAPATNNGGADNGGTGNGGTDPAPSDKTPEEMAFDDALEAAEGDLADARRMVNEAVAQAEAADTDQQKAAAMVALSAARAALADALMDAEALDPPDGDLARLGSKSILIEAVTEAQTADGMRISMAEGSIAWYGTALSRGALRATFAIIPEVAAVRTDRAKYDDDGTATGDSDDLLKASDLPPVMYADGKVLISGTEASSGDMLRLRGYEAGIVIDHATDPSDNSLETSGYQDLAAPTADKPTGGSNLLAGFQITNSGLVARLGGKGADGMDFRKGLGEYIEADIDPDNLGWDLRLTFGAPLLAADGNGDFQWTARLMPHDGLIGDGDDVKAASKAAYLVDGQKIWVTTYNIWLSNHAGVDTNLEDPDDPVASALDDVQHYLSYAAYGLMTLRTPATVNTDRPGAWRYRQRVHGFHHGYDAFKDEEGMKTTDIGDDDAITSGKFVGQTMAFAVGSTLADGTSAPVDIANAERLRGDVSLTATISGTSDNNKIEGTMSNFKVFVANGHYWQDYSRISGDVALAEGSIGANGSFSGVVTAPSSNFEDGQYSGNFYGPVNGLEVGGAWFLQADNDNSLDDLANKGIIGSFGAKMQ